MDLATPARMRSFVVFLLVLGCGDPGSQGGPDAGATGGPADLYDLTALTDPDAIELVILDDTVNDVEGRRLRTVRYGYLSGDRFPRPGTRFGVEAALFVEVDAGGTPLAPVTGLAVLLARPDGTPAGYGADCALLTGVACVLAGNVATPSQLDPAYPSEYGADGDTISDSNQLLFNLLAEMRRGTDVDGRALTGAPVRRAYITHIAEHGMKAITAARKLVVEVGLAAQAPDRVVIGGHSKWGAAAAQIAAVDERVVGAITFGFALDFLRFLEIADDRWRGQLGLDVMPALCPLERPCAWQSITELRDFFASTRAAPGDCDGAPCPGTGQDWLEQLDLARLLERGYLDERFALVRNGREAHAVDTEWPWFEAGVWPGQFLFAPGSGHNLDRLEHAALWRHWIRHRVAGASTARIVAIDATRAGTAMTVTVELEGVEPDELTLLYRGADDLAFGALDPVPGYQQDHDWQSATLPDGARRAELTIDPALDYAVVMLATFDDGSGDPTAVSSPVRVIGR
jgi:hypothetical protein